MTETPPDPGSRAPRGRTVLLAVTLTGGLLLDQGTKWAASSVVINRGGTSYLLPGTVRGLWEHPQLGAALDLLDLAPILLLVTLAARAREHRVAVGWALLAAGWASNWLDRLGLSALTQPGSPRGAVDWLRIPGVPGVYNLADGLIVSGGLLLAAVAVSRAGRGRSLLAATACLCLLAAWVGVWSGDRRATESAAVAAQLHGPARSMAQEERVLVHRISRAEALSRDARRSAAQAALAALVAGAPHPDRLLPPQHQFACDGPRRCVVTVTRGADVALVFPVHRPRWAERIGVPPGPCDGSFVQVLCGQVATAAVDAP